MSRKTDPAMKRAEIAVALIGAAMAMIAWGGVGFSFGASVFAGALLATLNLIVLARTVARLLDGSAPWVLVALLKFLVLFGATFVLIRRALVEPLGLAVGFGALPLGVLLASAFGGSRDEGHEEPSSSETAKEMNNA